MDDKMLKDLQKVELEILLEVDRICRKHNIKYFLVSGTLLGAVRHKGFIPWDDDIDICMPRKEYKKFCKIACTEMKKEYFLQNSNTDYSDRWFAKVRKNNTTCIEKGYEKSPAHQGVWIDIFPLVGVHNTQQELNKATKLATFSKRLLSKRFAAFGGLKDLSAEKKILKFVPVCIIRAVAEAVMSIAFKNNDKYESCYYLWGDSKIRARFPSDLFDDLCEVEFEGHMFPAPKRWDEYLTMVYGDYMTPPPPEKRNGGCHTISIIDLNKDYRHYTKCK